jgi:tRNA (mo5U34)-methyltransferase
MSQVPQMGERGSAEGIAGGIVAGIAASVGARTRPEIESLAPWFHNLHLPDGAQTAPDHPLGDFPTVKWRQIAPFVPDDLTGWRVLDVGCNAGFYSFELARRGAEVTGLDIDAHYLRQARWAARQYGLEARIEFREGSVYELARGGEQFDLVWFLGVLYHLRHPLLALDILRKLTRRRLVLQTLTMPGNDTLQPPASIGLFERSWLTCPGWPWMAFIEHSLAGDPTNWWAPNHACVEAMVRSAGFSIVARPGHEIYLCEPNPDEPHVGKQLREAELQGLFATGGRP